MKKKQLDFISVQVNHYQGIVMNEFVSEAQKQSRMLADKEKDCM